MGKEWKKRKGKHAEEGIYLPTDDALLMILEKITAPPEDSDAHKSGIEAILVGGGAVQLYAHKLGGKRKRTQDIDVALYGDENCLVNYLINAGLEEFNIKKEREGGKILINNYVIQYNFNGGALGESIGEKIKGDSIVIEVKNKYKIRVISLPWLIALKLYQYHREPGKREKDLRDVQLLYSMLTKKFRENNNYKFFGKWTYKEINTNVQNYLKLLGINDEKIAELLGSALQKPQQVQ